MSSDTDDDELFEEIDSAIDESLDAQPEQRTKGKRLAVKRTPKQREALRRRQAQKEAEDLEAEAKTKRDDEAKQLAQIVNLHIGGYSLAQIADSIGATPEEVDRMLSEQTARYVRNQPALRVFVRNWASERYATMLESVWDDASDKNAKPDVKFASIDRARGILADMTKLHGAAAPAQTEIKVEHSPEAVDKIVEALSKGEGLAYDTGVFDDVVDGEVMDEVVETIAEVSPAALNAASEEVEHDQPGDEDGL